MAVKSKIYIMFGTITYHWAKIYKQKILLREITKHALRTN